MSTRELQRRWRAPGGYALLVEATSLSRVPELHPLVHAVTSWRVVDGVESAVLHERVPLGPWWVTNRYRAARRCEAERIVLEAWSRPSVHVVHRLEVTERDGCAEVAHSLRVEAPWWFVGFVARTARTAHDDWIGRVQAWMSARAP